MSLTLTPDELLALTGFRRPSAQARVLKALGMHFLQRPNGTLVVDRATYVAKMQPVADISRNKRGPALRFD